MRVRWLQEVAHNTTHREYPLLSLELKTMVKAFRKARQSDDPVKLKKAQNSRSGGSRRVAPSTPIVEAAAVAIANDKVKDSRKSTLDVKQEEAFMAVALYHVEVLAKSGQREKVWELIVKDCGDRFEQASQARHRLTWLIKIFKTPDHREHKRLSPTLKDQIGLFLSFEPFQKLPRTRGKRSEDKTHKSHAIPASKDDNQRKKRVKRMAAKKSDLVSENEWRTIQPEMDELLIKLVIEKRPFEAHRDEKMQLWAEIANAVANPRLTSGLRGSGRCRWLVNVFENSAHDQHPNLTPKLRDLLAVFIKIYNAHLQKKSVDQNRNADASPTESPTAPTDMSNKPQQPTSNPLAEKDIVRLPREDSTLLREVLTVRPFHKNDETRTSLWQSVADNVAKTLGSKKSFPTGESCYERTGDLIKMLHNPAALAQVQLSGVEVEMLQLLDSMLKTRWMNLKRLQTENHRLLTAKIEAFLVRTTPTERPAGVIHEKSSKKQAPQLPPVSSELVAEVNHVEVETPTQHAQLGSPRHEESQPLHEDPPVPMEVVEPTREEQEPAHEERVSSRRRRRHERNRAEEEEEEEAKNEDVLSVGRDRSHKRRRKSHESRFHRPAPATSLILDEDQIHALQAEIVRLRSLCALSEADRKLFAKKITLLQDEVQLCRDQLTRQSNTLELERRDHRKELRAMVAMMQAEREKHQSETKAMLEAINKERDDRRSEFVAMMNLVTRSVVPPSDP